MSTQPTLGGSKGRLLLADDEPPLRRAYSRMLRDAGYTVEEVENGQQAADRLANDNFDAIVSDISMPDMDGLALLRFVRKHDLDVPVVLMTGKPSIETAARAVEHGAYRYLVKPVDEKTLVTHLNRAVSVHRFGKLKRQATSLIGGDDKQPGDISGLEAAFERAMDTLWIAYQPVVSNSEEKIYAFEALLRSAEPSLPSPPAVLDAAARLGRLDDLGRRIRDRVAEVASYAPAEFVYVNLHARDLMDDKLYEPAAPLSRIADRIVLEVTERATLDDVRDVRERVASLRKLGFRIALDDLGAGYAGLSSFASLEPDVVKFDMSLVRNVHQEPTKQRLIRSMVGVCLDMGIKVIAEGVEIQEERRTLVESGCNLLQGYLFAKPGKPFPTVAW